MKVRLSDVRRTIREEILHGVPEWQIREETARFVESLRDQITRYITINHSQSESDRNEAIVVMNETCDLLEGKIYDVVQEQLASFIRNV